MSEPNGSGDSRFTSENEPADEPAADSMDNSRNRIKLRMLIGGILFVAAAVVTFLAGDDNRWISIPGAIVAAAALVDVLSVNQRRRRLD